MSISVIGNTNGFKYEKIVENSVENNGLGWIEAEGDTIIAETTISSSDWIVNGSGNESKSSSGGGYDLPYYTSLNYVSNTNRISHGKTYILTATTVDGEEYVAESIAYNPSGYPEAKIAPGNVTYVYFIIPPFNVCEIFDDGTNLLIYANNNYLDEAPARGGSDDSDVTIELKESPTYNKIKSNFTDFVVYYNPISGIGTPYIDVYNAYISGYNILLNMTAEDVVFYIDFSEFKIDTQQFYFSGIYGRSSCEIILSGSEDYTDYSFNTIAIQNQVSRIYTGTCSTQYNTNTKIVTLNDGTDFFLTDGTKIAITFTNGIDITNSNNLTLNVNGTGNIMVSYPVGRQSFSTLFNTDFGRCASGETILFTCGQSGSSWIFEGSALGQYNTYNLASSALPKSGGTMTGALTLSGAPTANLHAATKKYVDDAVSNVDVLPSQSGNSGKFLTTNGTVVSWANVDALPSQTGNNGKILTTNGTSASWTSINYQPRYNITTATISSSGWSNGVYGGLQTTYPAASYDIDVELNGDTATAAQIEAWNNAQIVGSASTNNLIAKGTVPTVNIPVIVRAIPNTDTYLSDIESSLASI